MHATDTQRLAPRPPAPPRDPPAAPAPAGAPAVLDGPAFYDDAGVFARYQALRGAPDAPAHTLEEPVVLEFLGDPRERRVLDLGCGDGWLGRHLLERGAAAYLGLDGSRRMVDEARRTLQGTGGTVRLQDLERWPGEGCFDLAVSRLALQYVRRAGILLSVVHHHLAPGGVLVVSVEHPVMTCSFHPEPGEGAPRGWRVYDYFREGERADRWLGAAVRKVHRPLESWFALLRDAGFRVDRFSEARPAPLRFANPAAAERRLDVPMCAIFRCVREGRTGASFAPGARP